MGWGGRKSLLDCCVAFTNSDLEGRVEMSSFRSLPGMGIQ